MTTEQTSKKDTVRNMFNSIAPRYDFLNHFLSFGVDFYWRRRLLAMVKKVKPKKILDVATGTGDVAILLAKANPEKIIGLDLSESMLKVGQYKILQKKLSQLIDMQLGDSENLPYEDHQFDVVTVAFGVRNFENLELGLREINRVLKPGGSLFVLEFSFPRKFPLKQLYTFYSFKILPLIGHLVSNDASAYTYLPNSVAKFPAFDKFISIMNSCGYQKTTFTSLSGGIATIYKGEK